MLGVVVQANTIELFNRLLPRCIELQGMEGMDYVQADMVC